MRNLFLALLLLIGVMSSNAQMAPEMFYRKGKVYSDVSCICLVPTIELEQKMYKQSAVLYNQYKTAKGLKTTGSVLLGVGVPTLATGVILVSVTYADLWFYRFRPIYDAGWALFGIGAGLTTAGIPIYSVGLNHMKNCINAYNSQTSLTFLIKDNGVGLAINF